MIKKAQPVHANCSHVMTIHADLGCEWLPVQCWHPLYGSHMFGPVSASTPDTIGSNLQSFCALQLSPSLD